MTDCSMVKKAQRCFQRAVLASRLRYRRRASQRARAQTDVHDFLSACADAMAARTWRRAGMRTQAEARAHYITIFRRELCIVVTREFARHRLRRRCFIGVPRAAVRAHMQDRDDERRRRQHADVACPGEHRLHDLHRHQAMGPPVVAVRA